MMTAMLSIKMNAFVGALQKDMHARGYTVVTLADKLGKSHATIYGWLHGATPRKGVLRELADALGQPSDHYIKLVYGPAAVALDDSPLDDHIFAPPTKFLPLQVLFQQHAHDVEYLREIRQRMRQRERRIIDECWLHIENRLNAEGHRIIDLPPLSDAFSDSTLITREEHHVAINMRVAVQVPYHKDRYRIPVMSPVAAVGYAPPIEVIFYLMFPESADSPRVFTMFPSDVLDEYFNTPYFSTRREVVIHITDDGRVETPFTREDPIDWGALYENYSLDNILSKQS